MDHKGTSDEGILDPAEYLLKKTKYHDCHLTVGDPHTEEVERFGVVTSNLVAHSTVFREMLVDSELADPTGANTHITDVSPQIFKLMLIHVYGGQLPVMNRETAAQLALCADKYNIRRLLCIAAALLTPTTVDQVFPALRCVAYINIPNLKQHVTKIIQEQTAQVVCSKEFLGLDDNCVEFIVKQDKLAITELELWKNLVTWAQHQTNEPANVRNLLRKPLKHLRLLTLSQDEIVKEVMPAQILSPEEIVDLLSAVVHKQTLKSPELCISLQKRAFFTKVDQIKTSPANTQTSVAKKTTTLCNVVALCVASLYRDWYSVNHGSLKTSSNFRIKTLNYNIELASFSFQSLPMSRNENAPTYYFTCLITVREFGGGYIIKVESIKAEGTVACNVDVVMPIKLTSGQPLMLKANSSYDISLEFSAAHLTYECYDSYSRVYITEKERIFKDLMKLTFYTPFHLRGINFKY